MSDIEDVEGAIGEPPAEAENGDAKIVQRAKKGRDRRGRVPAGRILPAAGMSAAVETLAPPPAPPVVKKKIGPTHPNVAAAEEDQHVARSARDAIKAETTRNALARWPLVLELLREQALGPEAVTIRVYRTQMGQFAGSMPGEILMPMHIEGASVAGDEFNSASDQLAEAVTELYHLAGHFRGSAKYTLEFSYKSRSHGGTLITRGDMVLGDPEVILEQKRRAAQFATRQGGGSGGVGMARPFSPAPLQGYPAGGYQGPTAPNGPPQPPPNNFNPQVEELRRDLAQVVGMERATEQLRGLLASLPFAQQAPPAPPPPPPAPVYNQQEQEWIEEGRFRAMAARLGYVPRESQVAAPIVAPVVQQPPPAVVAASGGEAITGLESLLRSFEVFDKMRPRFAKLAGVAMPEEGEEGVEAEAAALAKPEDTNPMGLQEVPMTRFMGQPVMMPTKADGWVETFQSFIMANPSIAMEGLNRISGVLTSKAFTTLIERFTGMGGAPAQAAHQAVASGLVGHGAHELNGAAAHPALSAIAPLAPPVPAPPPPFRGPAA